VGGGLGVGKSVQPASKHTATIRATMKADDRITAGVFFRNLLFGIRVVIRTTCGHKMADPGNLYIIATPIGNMSDITYRALDTIRKVSLLLVEDTRVTNKLLAHYGIQVTMESLHDFNESGKIKRLIQYLRAGKDIGLVSDAGTPLINDPGYRLVCAVRGEGLAVRPVPGPSAIIAALSVSGLPADRFVFEGFLPRKVAEREAFLQALQYEPRSMVFFEVPHRVLEAIESCIRVFGGERPAALLRELTKIHEQHLAGRLEQIAQVLNQPTQAIKGECVLVIHGSTLPEYSESIEKARQLLLDLKERISHKDAVELVARHTGIGRNKLYSLGLGTRLKNQQ